ncbi:MAG: hypothetical protein MRT15_04300 [archaeon YNP-LCB-003-016]|uniref:hypothetical protein n=1 Tax=Candidatus Culexarchaeum yellowstonense TaxID=2928963 RepID=UPI0026F1D74D|nr:hypothetical protein [Candidatus Culexarchaeum yellowstonense]MCR6691590.1 hypothetical protein [Candidatus Culexarchaeum yellowstonense]
MLKGTIEILVKDENGKIVKYGRHEMHSFLNNFLKFLEAFMRSNGTGSVTITDTGGTGRTVYGTHRDILFHAQMGVLAPDNDDTYGIIVGSGTTPVNLNQYALVSKISHGTGSGQLDYNPITVDDYNVDTSVSPPVYRLRFVRSFANASGATVTINEVGIVVRYRCNNDLRFLVARDVLPTSYTVPAGGSATVAVTVEVELG